MFLTNFLTLSVIFITSNKVNSKSLYPLTDSKFLFPNKYGLPKNFNKILEKHPVYRENSQLRIVGVKPLRIIKAFPKVPADYLEPPTAPTVRKQKYLKKNRFRKDKSEKPKSFDDELKEKKSATHLSTKYVRDHDPGSDYDGEDVEEKIDSKETSNENEGEDDRLDFHVHGHQGPDSYIFGFDTGKGRNRQFRLEEKHENGTVSGYYGYYDPRGKLRKIHYISQPSTGYTEEAIQGKFRIIKTMNNLSLEKADKSEEREE